MPDSVGETARLLDLLRSGAENALNDLIAHTYDRLRHLASRMLKTYPRVGRWEDTGDVLQNALLRLCQALKTTTPETVLHFYNLAFRQVRWELIDLARHHLGPQGHGAKHHTDSGGKAADDQGGAFDKHPHEPESLETLTIFHQHVEALPEEEREVVGLLWYEGLTQEEAAAVLNISLRTVRRLWRKARLKLAGAMGDDLPA